MVEQNYDSAKNLFNNIKVVGIKLINDHDFKKRMQKKSNQSHASSKTENFPVRTP
jgi:hypothetical protein